MDYKNACKCYQKLKSYYNDKIEYDDFFSYYEKTWLSLISEDILEEKVFFKLLL